MTLTTSDLKEKLATLATVDGVAFPSDVCGYTVDAWIRDVAMPRIKRDVAQALQAHATHPDFLMEVTLDPDTYSLDVEYALAEQVLAEALYQ